MEYWDIYDAEKRPTGRTMKRNDWCLNSGKLGFQKCVEEIKAYIKIRFDL